MFLSVEHKNKQIEMLAEQLLESIGDSEVFQQAHFSTLDMIEFVQEVCDSVKKAIINADPEGYEEELKEKNKRLLSF